MSAASLRRAGFVATLVAGVAMLGSAVHGLVGVDAALQIADARPDAVLVADGPPSDRAARGTLVADRSNDRGGCSHAQSTQRPASDPEF